MRRVPVSDRDAQARVVRHGAAQEGLLAIGRGAASLQASRPVIGYGLMVCLDGRRPTPERTGIGSISMKLHHPVEELTHGHRLFVEAQEVPEIAARFLDDPRVVVVLGPFVASDYGARFQRFEFVERRSIWARFAGCPPPCRDGRRCRRRPRPPPDRWKGRADSWTGPCRYSRCRPRPTRALLVRWCFLRSPRPPRAVPEAGRESANSRSY